MAIELVASPLACLNYSKLYPPLPRASLQRPRLLCRLAAISRSKLALIGGEAGYGKTTLLVDFLPGLPYPAVWYRLDKSDRDVTQFATYLLEGVAQHVAGFAAEARERITAGMDASVAASLPHLLLHELSKLPEQPLLLVLDNFEAVVPSAEVCELVRNLLQFSGSEMRVVIASRLSPPLPLARLEARQESLVLGPEELALTREECRELLVRLHGSGITDQALDSIWMRTEGWPAGVVMIAEALRQAPVEEVVASLQSLAAPDLIYRYFAEEVFQEQSSNHQEFLLKTSILKRLSRDLVNELLAIDNGGELLSELGKSGTFAHGLEASSEQLRYHSLFRSFLLQKLHSRYGDEQIRELHLRAARAALRHGHWSDAVDHCASAGEWREVAELVGRVGDDLLRRGYLETLRHWLDLVPREEIASRPALLVLEGRLLLEAGRHREALRQLDGALRGLQQSNDPGAIVRAQLVVALAHYWRGEFRRAQVVLRDALQRAGDDPTLRARVLAELSRNCEGVSDLQDGMRWAEMAATECLSHGNGHTDVASLIQALRYQGRALILQGAYREGLQFVGQSVDLCRTGDIGDLETAWSLCFLGQGLMMQGALAQAQKALEEAETLAHGCLPLLDWVWTFLGTVRRDEGAFDQAERYYQRSAQNTGLRELAFLRLRQGRGAEGLRLAEEAFHWSWAKENPAARAACQAVHGMAIAQQGDRARGLQLLTAAAGTFRQRGRAHQLASIRWHIARLLAEEGRRQEAVEQLEKAVKWGSVHGVYHLWWWDPGTVARLWPLTLLGKYVPYLLELARLRLGPDECRFLYPALAEGCPTSQAQAAETIRVVASGSAAHAAAVDLLMSCADGASRGNIAGVVASGVLSTRDLMRWREGAGLTWKEIEIAGLYYLRPRNPEGERRFRRELAETMALSEHTLKVHIRNVRRKLELDERRRGQNTLPLLADGDLISAPALLISAR